MAVVVSNGVCGRRAGEVCWPLLPEEWVHAGARNGRSYSLQALS